MIRNRLCALLMGVMLTTCSRIDDIDRREAADQIGKALQSAEACLFDDDFVFPAILVGRKFAGKKLARFDALVSAGLLHEQVHVLNVPKDAPKHLYHYTKHHQIELKTFDLTDQGRLFYRESDEGGYFCYGRPELVEITALTLDGAKNGDDFMTVSFEYQTTMSAEWAHNELIQLEFPKIRRESSGEFPLMAEQRFVRKKGGAMQPLSGGALSKKIW